MLFRPIRDGGKVCRGGPARTANPVQTTAIVGGWWGNPWGFESPFRANAITKGISVSRRDPFFRKSGRVANLWFVELFRGASFKHSMGPAAVSCLSLAPFPTPQAGHLIVELPPYPFGLSTQFLVVTQLVGLSFPFEFPVVLQAVSGEVS